MSGKSPEELMQSLRERGARMRQRGGPTAGHEPRYTASEMDIGAVTAAFASVPKAETDFKPMFKSRELNHSVVIKTVVSKSEEVMLRPYQLATKVHFPYGMKALGADWLGVDAGPGHGGRYLYVNQRRYRDILNEYVFGGLSTDDRVHDMKLLGALNEVPSLDPFLVKDRLEGKGLSVHPAYLKIDESEWEQLRATIVDQFKPIALKAFGSSANLEAQAMVLAEKVWDATDLVALQPLSAAMQVPPEKASDVYYAWKGIIYYTHQRKRAQDNIAQAIASITVAQREQVHRRMTSTRYEWDNFQVRLNAMADEVASIVAQYEAVRDAFTGPQSQAKGFIEFFSMAPDLFWLLGGNLACIDHAAAQSVRMGRADSVSNEALEDYHRALVGVCSYPDGAP